jgi:hypothetical protein
MPVFSIKLISYLSLKKVGRRFNSRWVGQRFREVAVSKMGVKNRYIFGNSIAISLPDPDPEQSNHQGFELGSETPGTSVADPGCLSRIPDPDFYPSRIPDPGSKNSKKREG